jgi:hypothetical protein
MNKLILTAAAALLSFGAMADDFTAVPELTVPSYSEPSAFTVHDSTNTYGNTTVDSSYATMDLGGGFSGGIGSSTTYIQPGFGSDGPIMGTNSGSTSDTAYGGTLIYDF